MPGTEVLHGHWLTGSRAAYLCHRVAAVGSSYISSGGSNSKSEEMFVWDHLGLFMIRNDPSWTEPKVQMVTNRWWELRALWMCENNKCFLLLLWGLGWDDVLGSMSADFVVWKTAVSLFLSRSWFDVGWLSGII